MPKSAEITPTFENRIDVFIHIMYPNLTGGGDGNNYAFI
jgi:hypothetical protein